MGNPLGIDWGPVRTAVEKGTSCEAVARQFGISVHAVRKRAQREGWRGTVASSVQRTAHTVLSKGVGLSRTADMVADKASTKVATVIAEFVQKAVQQGEQIMNRAHGIAMTSESPGDMKNATIAWGIAHQHSRLAMGLDRADAGRDPIISVAQGGPIQPSKAIDVQTVSEPAPNKPNDGHKTD